MENPLLEVGVVIGAHGLKGLLRIKVFSGDPGGISEAGQVVLLLPDGTTVEKRLEKLQEGARGQALLGLSGIGDRASAEALRGARVALGREHLPPLAEGEFYLADLVGRPAVTPAGDPLGTVVEVGHNGAQPLIFVRQGGERFHVPAVAPFLRDFDGTQLVLDLPDGLREAVTEQCEEEP